MSQRLGYILPTPKIAHVLSQLVNHENTVIVIEHNLGILFAMPTGL